MCQAYVNKTDIVPDLKGYICLVGDKGVISLFID